tara:strand:+ start:2732 stop:3499 length:768 start_codon:yes stop_codon:yes gene_type:complete
MKRSKTNSGILAIMEKLIRNHPLIYYIARYFVRYTNIFEEDANGVKIIKFKRKINIIDVGASDGIASKFFKNNLNVNQIICYEPNLHYVKILKNLNIDKLTVKPYAIGNSNTFKVIYFPRYKIFGMNFDLIPYTYYDKNTLEKQLKLDFTFRRNIQIIKRKLYLKKIKHFNTKIDLIKIDVNDNGYSVIKCLEQIIKRDKPALLVETDNDIYKIVKILKKYNYDKYSFSIKKNSFFKVNKKYPLNTYFLKSKHLN